MLPGSSPSLQSTELAGVASINFHRMIKQGREVPSFFGGTATNCRALGNAPAEAYCTDELETRQISTTHSAVYYEERDSDLPGNDNDIVGPRPAGMRDKKVA